MDIDTSPKYCDAIKIKSGQILVHGNGNSMNIEIHTNIGWRIISTEPWKRERKDHRGTGTGDEDIRVLLKYSVGLAHKDELKIKHDAWKRTRTTTQEKRKNLLEELLTNI